ncbi:phage tail tip lysozyme [Paraburkholderia strydomiana]
MPEVKIGVGANASGVDAAINKITQSMNKLGAAVAANQKLKFEPTDVKNMARDLDLINKQFKQTLALSGQLRNALKASGQTGLHISQIDWTKTSTDLREQQRLRDRAFSFSVRGTSLDPSLSNGVDAEGNAVSTAKEDAKQAAQETRARDRESAAESKARAREEAAEAREAAKDRNRPGGFGRGVRRYARGMAGRTAGAFGGGIGGPVGGVLQEGIQGAGAGAEAGGLLGGLGGLGAGLAGGGAVAIAAMAGKAISEGLDQAKQRSYDLDTLKRQMGDLGVSFDGLSDASWKAAQGLGIANGEFVKMEQLAQSSSGGAYRTPDELASTTRSGVDLARAYGLQPGQGVGFVAGMQRLDSHQNNKELATQLANALVSALGKATPGEVMQAMQGFSSAQNRFNSGSVDLDRFGNAFASMLTGNMTADHASSILGQANSAMQQMGGTEAGRNFTMQAFGSLDPVRAAMRAEGGLFGNGLDNPSISTYMRAHGARDWDGVDKGPEGSNFSVMRGAFDRAYAGRGAYGAAMELDAEKNYFGLKSYADTASFMNMSDSTHNGISTLLKNAGVKLSDVREGGLQALSGILMTDSFGDLDKLYKSDIRNRPDMSDSDKSSLDRAEKSGDFQQFQNELVRVLAGKGQEDDAGSTQRSIDANISDMKTMIGERLLPYTQAIMQGVLAFANKIPGVNIADPSAEKSGRLAPMGYGGGTNPNARVDQSGIAAGPMNSIANSVDAGNKWAGGLAEKVNFGYGKAQGLLWKYNGGVNDGMKQLAEMGVDPAHAAAIMANAAAESSMRPEARNGHMYGLFQFDESRQADFQKVMGKSIVGSTAAEQIEYMVKSMRDGGEEAGPGKGFWAASGGDLAGVFASKIERTDHPGKNSDIRNGIASQLGDIHITLQQNIAGSNGQSKTKTLSTKVGKPSASGIQTPTIIQLPG